MKIPHCTFGKIEPAQQVYDILPTPPSYAHLYNLSNCV